MNSFLGQSCVKIEAPEVIFPMEPALHQNSNYAKSYAYLGEGFSVSVQLG